MPLPVQFLRPDSSEDEIERAKARSIEQCIHEGKPQSRCIAIVYQMIERATNKSTWQLTKPKQATPGI